MIGNIFRRSRLFGILIVALSLRAISAGDTLPAKADSRVFRLENFLRSYHCPAPLLTSEYLAAADEYNIDYRLLPALSVRESTCGLHARLNNRWGWNSAQTGFATLVHGIRFIARELAFGRYYRGKTLDEKLLMYNPLPPYPKEVRKLMREIEAD